MERIVIWRTIFIIFIVMGFTCLLCWITTLITNLDNSSHGSCDEYGDHFEGDIVLNPMQFNDLKSNRSVWRITMKHWPGGLIPYQMTTDHTQKQRDQIKHALAAIESVSCLKFRNRSNETDYVQLSAKEKGCFSALGYQGGAQVLNLEKTDPGCFVFGTIIHEFLHALGFLHTQNEYGRDNFVSIKWESVFPHHAKCFKVHQINNITNSSMTYDYLSIMHFKSDAFSKNGTQSIIPLNASYTGLIGQRQALSVMDIAKIKQEYCNERL